MVFPVNKFEQIGVQRSVFLVALLDHLPQLLHQLGERVGHDVGSSWVLDLQIVSGLPLVDVVFVSHSVAVVVEVSLSHLEIIEPDPAGESSQVVELDSLLSEVVGDFVGLVVHIGQDGGPSQPGVVAAVSDWAGVVVGVEPVEEHLGYGTIYYEVEQKLSHPIPKPLAHMSKVQTKTLRLGDCLNYPAKGQLVGVHYILRNQFQEVIESTRERGKMLEWRIGSASVLEELDEAIKKVSLGGKELVKILGENDDLLTYEIELIYIK